VTADDVFIDPANLVHLLSAFDPVRALARWSSRATWPKRGHSAPPSLPSGSMAKAQVLLFNFSLPHPCGTCRCVRVCVCVCAQEEDWCLGDVRHQQNGSEWRGATWRLLGGAPIITSASLTRKLAPLLKACVAALLDFLFIFLPSLLISPDILSTRTL